MPPPRAPPPWTPTPDSTRTIVDEAHFESDCATLHAQRRHRCDRVVHEIGDDENMHEFELLVPGIPVLEAHGQVCASLCGTWLDTLAPPRLI